MKIKISPSWGDLGIQDEIGLLSQIYGGDAGHLTAIDIIHIDSENARLFADSQEHLCSIEKLSTLHKFIKLGGLAITRENTISMNLSTWHLHSFSASIDWTKLHELAGFYHDHETEEPYGTIQQEKIMRKIIIEKAKKTGSHKLELSEKDLGTFITQPIDCEHYSYDKSPDRNVKFMATLFQLEREQFITITGLDYNFDATRIFIKTIEDDDWSDAPTINEIYYPAEHCHVEIELLNNEQENKQKDTDDLHSDGKIISITANWRLVEKEHTAYIHNGNKTIFTFPHITSNSYVYFRHLCKHYDTKIAYEDMYQAGKGVKGWNTLKRWETNAAVRRTINKLKKDFKNQMIKQIHINTKEYLKLTISS